MHIHRDLLDQIGLNIMFAARRLLSRTSASAALVAAASRRPVQVKAFTSVGATSAPRVLFHRIIMTIFSSPTTI